MNVVSSIYGRELGNSFSRSYDIALGRLKCYDYDEFRGISPSTEGPDYNPEPPVFACRFCTTPLQEHLLALANEDGKIAIQDTNLHSDHNPFEGQQAHHNAIFDIAWAPGEMCLVSASGDHTAVLWNVSSSGRLQEVSRFHSHTRSVKTVAFPQEDKMMFATGARDGVIMLWDTRTQRNQGLMRPDNFISSSYCTPGTPSNPSGSRNRRTKTAPSRAASITGLVFQNVHHLIACGAGDGKIKVWDLRKTYSTCRREPQPLHCMFTPGEGRTGFTSLALDPGRLKLYASCMDNTIYGYNIATYEKYPVCMFSGHKNGTFYVKTCLSPDGRYLLSGSSDDHAYIWDTVSFKESHLPMVKLVGHGAEVTCVAWCSVGDLRIATCSDDARHCLWRVGLEHEGDNDQVRLHGWAEAGAGNRSSLLPSSPMTPATPSFTSLRKWAARVERTPDSASPRQPCNLCHRMSTPCMRCLALRGPSSGTSAAGSKKCLEVLWEQPEEKCPECEREAKQVLTTVSSNGDVPARRLFSPKKKQRVEADVSATCRETSSREASSPAKRRSENNACDVSPRKKLCTSGESSPRVAPREQETCRVRPESDGCSPSKRRRINEGTNAGEFSPQKDISLTGLETEACSPSKRRRMETVEQAGPSASSSKKVVTPLKRRISERPTNSPHKRLCDDLQGISKIDDETCPSGPTERRGLCARHRRAPIHSPTLNLPNYVVDGTSPHHSCSPVHHHKENVDWLTRLRRERNSTEKRQEAASTSALTPPARSSTSSRSSANRTTPGKITAARTPTPSRTTSNRSEKKGTKRKANSETLASASVAVSASTSQENLLRFFRVSGKTCEQQCSVGISNASQVDTPV